MALQMAVEDRTSVLIPSGQSSRELNNLPLKLVITPLKLSLLRSLANTLEVGGYDAVQLVFEASIAAFPWILDDVALQLHNAVSTVHFTCRARCEGIGARRRSTRANAP